MLYQAWTQQLRNTAANSNHCCDDHRENDCCQATTGRRTIMSPYYWVINGAISHRTVCTCLWECLLVCRHTNAYVKFIFTEPRLSALLGLQEITLCHFPLLIQEEEVQLRNTKKSLGVDGLKHLQNSPVAGNKTVIVGFLVLNMLEVVDFIWQTKNQPFFKQTERLIKYF